MLLGEELLSNLDELRQQLNYLVDRLELSGVSRTVGLRELGTDCPFYRKSMDIFLRKDYIDLRNSIKKCTELFEMVEGNAQKEQ
jgi:hypothetical protein